ncbi:flagellar brake protein [Exilibacterium tricleocarpae]|nr:flagellar brake protein [Exilibacterium tricleocarpae]
MSLLQSVLRKFYRPESASASAASATEPGSVSRLHHYSPLMTLLEKRQLLEVINDQTGERYQSMILDVNVVAGLFMLDDLFPANPTAPVQVGDALTLRHHHNGQVLSFSAPVIDIEQAQTAPLYTLKLPKEVGYRQRRRWPRVDLRQPQPLTVRLKSPWSTPWFATAQNLSAGGMRLRIGGNLLDQLHCDQALPLLEFQFNRDFRVRCQARVKGFRFCRRPHRHTQLSVEFVDMPAHQRIQLEAFVSTLIERKTKAA